MEPQKLFNSPKDWLQQKTGPADNILAQIM